MQADGKKDTSIEAFLADDETTWPDALTDLLAANLAELKAFHKFDNDVNWRSAKGDLKVRLNPPFNPSRPTRERVLAETNAIIADASVVGYHCGRLLDLEIDAILAGGLKPLSVDLVREKNLCGRCDRSSAIRPGPRAVRGERGTAWQELRGALGDDLVCVHATDAS